jgi:hypothetical protein
MPLHILFGAWLVGIAAQGTLPPPAPLEVHLDVPEGRFVRPDDGLDLLLSRPLAADDGRLAVVIGNVDWTSLFVLDGRSFRVRGGLARLPQGESDVVVYLVTPPNDWRQVATLPLRVTTPAGFERATLSPAADLANLGQDVERHEPDSNVPPRATFQDFTSHIGLGSEHVRSGVTVRTQTNLLAVSNRTQALRFGEAGNGAPRLDLSDYVWSVESAHVKVTAGNVTFNADRHLVPNFATRGLGLTVRYPGVDMTVAAVNGQAAIGFSNFLGVTRRNNQVALAAIGAELLRDRPGGARVEAALVDGTRAAQSGFTQGRISDVLKSHGESLRFLGSDPARRLRLDTGFARTWSTNPVDPLLDQGFTVVAVKPRTGHAEYLDAGYDIVRNARLAGRTPVTLTGAYRFERVDPFFASVAAPQGVPSDLLQNTVSVNTSVGQVTAQVSQAWSHDNLGRVASILRTDTRHTTANLAVPTGTLGQPAAAAVWWPVVTYALDRSRQTGEGTPANGGFVSPSQVPDQINTVHTLAADWTFARWHAGYSLNHSFQDNRQPGRETSDFANLVQQVAVGLTPVTSMDLTLTLDRERATNVEFRQVNHTTRGGLTVNWRMTTRSTVNAILNRTAIRDATAGPNDVTDVNLQYSYAFSLPAAGAAKPRLQLFARWTWQSSNALDLILGAVNDRRNWALSTGATLTLF